MDVELLRAELLYLLDTHPPINWSSDLLTAVAATVRVEIAAKNIGHVVNRRPRLRIV